MQQITNTHAAKVKSPVLSLAISWFNYFRHLFFAAAYIYRIWFPFICRSFRRLFGLCPIPYKHDLSL